VTKYQQQIGASPLDLEEREAHNMQTSMYDRLKTLKALLFLYWLDAPPFMASHRQSSGSIQGWRRWEAGSSPRPRK
jgi:hypothetical protein